MDDIIQKLIEFDRQCVVKVELAKKKKAEAQSSMMSQKSTIYSEYIDSQQDQVEKHKQLWRIFLGLFVRIGTCMIPSTICDKIFI